MKVEGVELGDLLLLAPSQTDDGRIGYGARIAGHFGQVYLGASAEDYRAAAKFFTELADDQAAREKRAGETMSGCGCSCNPVAKVMDDGGGFR